MDLILEEVKERLWRIGTDGRRVVIQWVPGHVGVDGNEWADRVANQARQEDQEEAGISLPSAKKQVYRHIRYKPQLDERLAEVYNRKITKAEGSRALQVLTAQLRSGHCTKTGYYLHRIGKLESAACSKCGLDEGKDHWLECGAVDAWRRLWGLTGVSDLADGRAVGGFLRSAYPEWVS